MTSTSPATRSPRKSHGSPSVSGQAQLAATERVRLARLAGEAVAAAGEVAATTGDAGAWMTRDGDRFIPGVVAAMLPEGRVELTLHVDAVWPVRSLDEVADALRGRVAGSADAAGLGDRLGPVAVAFHDMRAPEDER
jgi:hypothetical protein